MADTQKLKNRRIKLWNENPNCCYCNKPTNLDGNPNLKTNPFGATIEHINSRFSEKRQSKNLNNERRYKLACFKCNWTRGQDEIKQLNSTPNGQFLRQVEQEKIRSQNRRNEIKKRINSLLKNKSNLKGNISSIVQNIKSEIKFLWRLNFKYRQSIKSLTERAT